MYKWKTFCPRSRKALRGRKYNSNIRLPTCTEGLGTNHCKTLCRKCDSIPTDPSKGPTLWHCPDHLELVSEESDASLAEAEAFFGKAVALWPADTRARYLRRKADKTFKDVWWSY
ncbi:hypothetical protein GGR51DRAFT_556172 [Nemania sp. FL0031]|nr:hypothetical protein GGR51DRAFT_556172 [Nemania sp. FL0031]